MLIRALAVALALCATPLAGAAELIEIKTAPAEVLKELGLHTLFDDFGRTIAASPRQQGLAAEPFLAAWEAAAVEAFGSPELYAELTAAIGGELTGAELDQIGDFFESPFGDRIASLERATQTADPADQLDILAKGTRLYWDISATRREQFEELMVLASADVTFAMMEESVRGMMMGMYLARGGDIEVPWDEIDAMVATQLEGMQASLAEATRAALAYTYDTLTDEEVEAYLVFLRTPASRNFYAVTSVAIGDIIRRTMFDLGETLALRLNRVAV